MSQFNHTIFNKESVFELLKGLNEKTLNGKLKDDNLKKTFDKYWEDFEIEFNKILAEETCQSKVSRSMEDILEEVLSTVRIIDKNF